MATQVKLYIEPEQEIRRFTLEANATFEQLRQRVEGLVGHGNFRIQWQDSERDMIVLGSADELAAAKEVLTNDLLRLFVRPIQAASGEKKVHRGVTCDGCGGAVAGSRAKCLECPDFDLCESCHGKGMHQEHDFIVIRAPRSSEWKKVFAQGYGTREGFPQGPTEPAGPCGSGRRAHCGPRAPGAHHRPHFGMGPFGAGFPGGHPFFGPFAAANAGPFGPTGPTGPCGRTSAGPTGPCGRTSVGPTGPCGRTSAGPTGPCGRRGPGFCGRRAHGPRDETVEVDVDMNRPVAEIIADVAKKVQEAIRKQQSRTATPSSETEQLKTEEEKTEETEAVASVVNAVAEAVTVVSDVVTEFVEELTGRAESENGEWTHLEAEGVEEGKPQDKQPVQPEKPSQDEQNAKDQRIENALRALEEMGFPNEGLLMRRLLENYNGDLNRVLDSIK